MSKYKRLRVGTKVNLYVPTVRGENKKYFATVLAHYRNYILFDLGSYKQSFSKWELSYQMRWKLVRNKNS
jgi:hypothetical protein